MKMKSLKKSLLASVVVVLLLALVSYAHAVSFTETFLGPDDPDLDGDYFPLAEVSEIVPGVGNQARFNFDLTGSGGLGILLYTAGESPEERRVYAFDPSLDESSYDPLAGLVFTDGHLMFWFSDFDNPVAYRERIRIDVGLSAGGRDMLLAQNFQLDVANPTISIDLDLGILGYLAELQDGLLTAYVIAPDWLDTVSNDFILDRVSLTATAAPVPEPATLLLVGTGLLGIVRWRRRKA